MSSKVVEWSDLPEDLVDFIANRLFSSVELRRVRGICKPWRSAVAINKRLPNHRKRHRRRLLSPYAENPCSLSPAAFFRVVFSSCPNKGWLIKTQDAKEKEEEEEEEGEEVSEFRKNLLSPLSRLLIKSSDKTVDLLDFTVSEIHQSYGVYFEDSRVMSYRSVLVDNLVFAVDSYKKLWWCNSGEEGSNNHVWTRILDEDAKYFSDIIVHKGQIYALDYYTGAIWWISLSDLNIFQYGPSTPMEYYEIDDCKDKRLVEYCGDLCIVHRFCKKFRGNVERTVGFKVYKMDEELVEWFEVKSLGDKALVMAMDSCFSVFAREYYGCLEDAIYFIDWEEKKNNIKVFKLGDASIINMAESSSSSSSETCFQMFSPPFASDLFC